MQEPAAALGDQSTLEVNQLPLRPGHSKIRDTNVRLQTHDPTHRSLESVISPSSTMNTLSTEQKHQLRDLLQRKLFGIPHGHLPTLTLTDVVDQTRRAVNLPK